MITGQGTLGLEILDQLPNLDYLFIAVGGGGLIAGVAAYVKMVRPQVVIVGCQPEASPVMSKVRYRMSYIIYNPIYCRGWGAKKNILKSNSLI